MAKAGRPFSDNPKRARITVRMTDQDYEKLQQSSKKAGMTILDYVRTIIEEKENSGKE